MTLRSLEVFLAVVEKGNMRVAAESLYISQLSVSGAVAELEREYGVRLFERLGKKLYITQEGQKLAGYARRMMSLNGEMKRQMGSAEDDTPLRIGATVTVGTCIIGDLIAHQPGAMPKIWVGNTQMIEQKLLQNELDVALVEGPLHSEELTCTPVIRDELCLICADDHPMAKASTVSLEQLAALPLIMRERESGARETIDRLFASEDLTVDVVWECNNTQAMLNAVRNGFGVTLLSYRLIADQPGLRAIPLADERLMRWFSLVVHKDKFMTGKLSRFLELCKTWENQ